MSLLDTYSKSKFTSPSFKIGILSFMLMLIIQLLTQNSNSLFIDEKNHYLQIITFMSGDCTMDNKLTTLPGFHLFYAIIGAIFHNGSILFFRIVSLFVSATCIFFFAEVDRLFNHKSNPLKTYLFISLPFVFPFLFLIYTDILSLTVFLISLYFGLQKKYQLAFLFGIINLLIRQNTFFWFGFTFCYFYFLHYQTWKFKDLKDYVLKGWTFFLGVILFIIFIFINHGVAMGDKSMHPGFELHLGNVYFCLSLMGIFIAPFQPGFYKLFKLNWRDGFIFVIALILYFLFFRVNHPYNLISNFSFLRNEILLHAVATPLSKLLFFLPIALGILLLIRQYKDNKLFTVLFLIFGLLSLLPSWLIEQRYYFIHIALFLLFGFKDDLPKFSPKIITVFFGMGLFIIHAIYQGMFFL